MCVFRFSFSFASRVVEFGVRPEDGGYASEDALTRRMQMCFDCSAFATKYDVVTAGGGACTRCERYLGNLRVFFRVLYVPDPMDLRS